MSNKNGGFKTILSVIAAFLFVILAAGVIVVGYNTDWFSDFSVFEQDDGVEQDDNDGDGQDNVDTSAEDGIVTSAGGTLKGGSNENSMVYYYLTEDVTLEDNLTISGYVTLCLNEYTLTGNGEGSVITLSDGAYFVLCECDGTIKGGSASYGGGVYVGYTSTFVMNGGTISGNTDSYVGGGVYVIGTFIMNDGEISGNTATSNGGGVYIDGGTFEMNNGTISNNTSGSAGGGYFGSVGSEFIMKGGEISDNVANSGGGVYSSGTFTMTGGTITDNEAVRGGGVYSGGTFIMNGGTIAENTATNSALGNGLYISGTFTMTGGFFGGSVYSNNGTISISGGYLSEDAYSSDYITEGYTAELTNEYADFPYAVVSA